MGVQHPIQFLLYSPHESKVHYASENLGSLKMSVRDALLNNFVNVKYVLKIN